MGIVAPIEGYLRLCHLPHLQLPMSARERLSAAGSQQGSAGLSAGGGYGPAERRPPTISCPRFASPVSAIAPRATFRDRPSLMRSANSRRSARQCGRGVGCAGPRPNEHSARHKALSCTTWMPVARFVSAVRLRGRPAGGLARTGCRRMARRGRFRHDPSGRSKGSLGRPTTSAGHLVLTHRRRFSVIWAMPVPVVCDLTEAAVAGAAAARRLRRREAHVEQDRSVGDFQR